MEMMTCASACYKKGYTCAQAILCAYADNIGVEMETAYRLMEGFGCGIGGMGELCSALVAIVAMVSYYSSDGDLVCGGSHPRTDEKVGKAVAIFRREYGGLTCRELLGGRCPKPLQCGMKVKDAVLIIEQVRKEKA